MSLLFLTTHYINPDMEEMPACITPYSKLVVISFEEDLFIIILTSFLHDERDKYEKESAQ